MKRAALILLVFMCGFSAAPALAKLPAWAAPRSIGGGFGVQIKDGFISPEELQDIKETGFGFVRFSFGWSEIEPAKDVYDFSRSDALIAAVRAAGLKMVIPLMGGHALYDGWVPAPKKNVDHVTHRMHAPDSAESVRAYARFAAAMAARYPSDDIVWEIWNEPDLARFWPPAPDAKAFAALAKLSCQTMRAAAPGSVIIGPALGRVPDAGDKVTPDFFQTFLKSGGLNCFDAVSVHPYRHGDEVPEAALWDYQTLGQLMKAAKVAQPLMNTEWGYTTTQVSQEQQAAYILRTRFVDLSRGVPLTIWYEWRDSRPDPKDDEGHFGLLTWDGADKLAMKRVRALLPQIRDLQLEQRLPTENPMDFLFLLARGAEPGVVVGWSLDTQPHELTFSYRGVRRAKVSAMPEILASEEELGEDSRPAQRGSAP